MKLSTLNLINGVLGLWVILIILLGFSSTLNQILLFLTGAAIAVCGFRAASLAKGEHKYPESEIMPASPAGGPASASTESVPSNRSETSLEAEDFPKESEL